MANLNAVGTQAIPSGDAYAINTTGDVTNGIQNQLPGLDGPYTYSNFMYPMNLGVSGGYDHYVLFYINQTSNTQFHTRQLNQADQQTTKEAADNQWNQAYGGGNNNDGMNGVMQTVSGAASGGYIQPRANTRVATVIALYMPPQIGTAYATKWTGQSMLGADLAANILTGQGDKSAGNNIMDFGKNLFGSVIEGAGSRISQETDLNIGQELARRARMAVNPHLEVIFDGIDFRHHKFTFQLMAQRQEEADNIYNIIKAFKFYAAPEVLQSMGSRYFIYPAEFDIKFISNGQENPYLSKISTSALTNIEVNYTASGQWAAFRQNDTGGSPPVSIMLSLTFMELEIITKKRIMQGYSLVPPWLLLPFIHPVLVGLVHTSSWIKHVVPTLCHFLTTTASCINMADAYRILRLLFN